MTAGKARHSASLLLAADRAQQHQGKNSLKKGGYPHDNLNRSSKKYGAIHIKGRRTVNTMMAGQYRSVFRGSGIEFEEVREYVPGDDVKAIDWKVSARLGRPFVKLYREERESIVMLLVDMSASQAFGTRTGLKLEKTAEVASVLAFSAVKNNDKVGALFFTDQVEKIYPSEKRGPGISGV